VRRSSTVTLCGLRAVRDDHVFAVLVAREDLAQFGDQFSNGIQFLQDFRRSRAASTGAVRSRRRRSAHKLRPSRITSPLRFPALPARQIIKAVSSALDFPGLTFSVMGTSCSPEIIEQVFFRDRRGWRTRMMRITVSRWSSAIDSRAQCARAVRFFQLENSCGAGYIRCGVR